MRIKKSLCNILAAAIAAGTFAVMPLAFAEVKEYEGFGEYVMSDFETPDVAKQRAKARAEQNAMEQAGVYVESYIKVINHQVTHDEIATMTNGILKVKDVQYSKMTPTEDGKGILIRVTIKADIDTENISKWLEQNNQNVDELIEQNERLQKAKEEQDKKIKELQKQVANVKTIKDKNEIQEKFTAADQEFLSNQKVEEGIKLNKNKDYVGAVVAFSKAAELNPKNENAYFGLGYSYIRLKDSEKAIDSYTKAILLAPDNASIYCNRGNVFMESGNFIQALADYTKAIALNPKMAVVYNNRGAVNQKLGNYVQALNDYTTAIELGPQFATAFYNRGRMFDELGNFLEAIENYTKAINLKPKYAEAYYNRGIVYEKTGNYANANADFAMAKSLGLVLNGRNR